MKKYIPNTITCGNLATGCIATVMAFNGEYAIALLCIILSAVFDFFDGMAARVLNAHSPIGKDLDSLADDISFGLAPAAMVFSMFQELNYPEFLLPIEDYIPYFAFLIAIFSALRLAKFNVDTRQKSSFIGLPVPANALFWASLTVCYRNLFIEMPGGIWILMLIVMIFSYLLVSEIPMFSLKFKNLRWNDNKISFTFLLICIPMIVFFQEGALALIILWYILLSVFTQKKQVV